MSELFVALCPALDHRDSSASLNQHTWAQRGWCRTERMVREVTAPKKALILLIESPKHLAVLPAWESNFYSPGLRLRAKVGNCWLVIFVGIWMHFCCGFFFNEESINVQRVFFVSW